MLRVALAAAAVLALASCSMAEAPSQDEPQGPAIGARGGMCGGIAGFQCTEISDFCSMPIGQCVEIADASGLCAQKPQACTREYRPVCGCDGETYANACTAAAAGVSIAAEGACAE